MVSARPYLTSVRHIRTGRVANDFRYAGVAWLVDLDGTDPLPRWLSAFVGFRAGDHLGDPRATWRDNLITFAASQGVTIGDGPIQAMSGARTLGYAFDPITLYWCHDASGSLTCVIAEVRNTYRDRHVYLVRPDERSAARTDKAMYVSPFNDVSGYYQLHVPPPAPELDVRIVLHRSGHPPFVTTWAGTPARSMCQLALAMVRAPLSAQLVTARIHWQGVKLWLRRLPVVVRPRHHPQEAV
ncbi:hypothetical protein ATK17_0768 [Branchiibius hedensis]|uniref:DUF1365 family protein n=1 Tax=Branchiibius hedensis TaxID=672460 RepID=A0A2Y8ZQ21_9MICO|nr:DUF1365 domain-containing protein [Branchiibius hedensis]PWJ24669.1 hypothetical protein ATK17_0768 [Branchiibius hedensis]SSA33486.1 hypothetical protein SAMN04489750_0768 [Branchiibius hedensis]